MIGRVAIVALAMGLSACAGLEPAGRNAGRAPQPTASSSTPAPATQAAPPVAESPSPTSAATPAPGRATAPPVAAAQVAAPPSTTPAPTAPRPASADEDVVVPGQSRVQVPPPGDPRSNEERMADIRAWDQCVMQVQNAFDADPMRPQLTTPEEYCRETLGMTERLAVPISRSQRRR